MYGTKNFPRKFQFDSYSCGPKSVHSILTHFEINVPYDAIFRGVNCTPEKGTTYESIEKYLRASGLGVRRETKMTFKRLKEMVSRGVVLVDLDTDHYAVVYGVNAKHVWLADPSILRTVRNRVTHAQFKARWHGWGLVIFA